MTLMLYRPWGNDVSNLTNSIPVRLEEANASLAATPPVGAELILNDLTDYVTPPSKKVVVVPVRYGEAKKGAPMPYDLPATDNEP
jgi:hypothetical protein